MIDKSQVPFKGFPTKNNLIEEFSITVLNAFQNRRDFAQLRTLPFYEREEYGNEIHCIFMYNFYKVSVRFDIDSCLPYIWLFDLNENKNKMLFDKDTSLFKHSERFRQIQKFRLDSMTKTSGHDLIMNSFIPNSEKECRYGSYLTVFSDNKLLIEEYAEKLYYHLKDDLMDELFNLKN
jgi:hypothetical protein